MVIDDDEDNHEESGKADMPLFVHDILPTARYDSLLSSIGLTLHSSVLTLVYTVLQVEPRDLPSKTVQPSTLLERNNHTMINFDALQRSTFRTVEQVQKGNELVLQIPVHHKIVNAVLNIPSPSDKVAMPAES